MIPFFNHISRIALFMATALSLTFCQQTEETATDSEPTESATEPLPEKRPAPEFFVIAPDMAQNRMWICEDESSDIFHTQHDCSLLVQCKGTFRNVTLIRAVEDYGRYNCQVCSRELDHIFDEGMVR
ncbi:hypothetical protein ACXYMU_12665 [Pontibacter sp. CAU 1760]